MELEDNIYEAVNVLHQLGDELAGFVEGRLTPPSDKHIARARAAGIAIQASSVADRLCRAFNEQVIGRPVRR